MEELIFAIQEAANTIASPNWADIRSVHLSFAAFVASVVVATIQCVILIKQMAILKKQTSILEEQASISKNQASISREQTFISKEQASISKEQTSILERQASIADKQNKIALFEKRLEIHKILFTCKTSVDSLESVGKNKDISKHLFLAFTRRTKREDVHQIDPNEIKFYLANCAKKLYYADIFFSDEIAYYIINISAKLLALAYANIEDDGIEEYCKKKQKYFEAVKNLNENDIFTKIEEEMKVI